MFLLTGSSILFSQKSYESDIIKTSLGDLKMTFLGHATLMFEYNDIVIHIDPVSRYADYTDMPDADLILISHHHRDHLDIEAIRKIRKKSTVIIYSEKCSETLKDGEIMNNGDVKTI
jgi:L-ascorbate metabolism protein UlaG (beta-lactamase superfamily)